MILFELGAKIIDKILPDTEARDKAKAELAILQQRGDLKELESAMQVVVAEAKGESWLQRSWRPITMLTFVSLVVAKWLGLTAQGVTEQVELELMNLIQIGLGGYVIGRSVEKGVKEWKK